MKQPQHLRPLHKRLARLRRRRRRFRRATAISALAIAVLWALAGVFALDWHFQRNVDLLQRLLLLGFAAAAVIWAFARFALPWLGKREDETDMALLVERQTGIDSDLVAALQFESAEAAGWGSTQLETAVIDRVANRQKNLDVMAAMPHQPLALRLKLLLATATVWALLGLLAPEYVRVFFQRLAFGAQHYPSQTRLAAVTVNGKSVDFSLPRDAAVRIPYGHAVRFEVAVAGLQPASGRVELSLAGHGPAAHVPLKRPDDDGDPPLAQYRGEYPALNQSARYQVYLGDAWTEPLLLKVTPLPVVEMEAEVVLPVYARQSAAGTRYSGSVQELPRGMRHFSVLAGSEVRLRLDSDRPLEAAEVKSGEKTYPMQRADRTHHAPRDVLPSAATSDGGEVWTLATAGTPLASVAEQLKYSIQVHDAEDQTWEQPLEGSIAIEPDLPPAIAAATKTPIVLPTGSPTMHYEASDDHALSGIWLTWEATSGDASQVEQREGRIEVCRFSPEASPRSREGDYRLPLQSLPLRPGDTLKVIFHVRDYRGPATAASVDADPPLVFQVTDLPGFLASQYDADQKTSGVLEDLHKKHTGVGEKQ